MPSELTERQAEILAFIRLRMAETGIPLTVQDVTRQFGMSRNGALCHIRALRQKGVLAVSEKNLARCVRPANMPPPRWPVAEFDPQLKPSERRVLRAIMLRLARNPGLPPTIREILDDLNLRSTNAVKLPLDGLTAQGYLAPRVPGQSRAFRILKVPPDFLEGDSSCGSTPSPTQTTTARPKSP